MFFTACEIRISDLPFEDGLKPFMAVPKLTDLNFLLSVVAEFKVSPYQNLFGKHWSHNHPPPVNTQKDNSPLDHWIHQPKRKMAASSFSHSWPTCIYIYIGTYPMCTPHRKTAFYPDLLTKCLHIYSFPLHFLLLP